jgi:hypothetical protein
VTGTQLMNEVQGISDSVMSFDRVVEEVCSPSANSSTSTLTLA